MSIKSQIKRAVARSGVAVGDFQALQREIGSLTTLVESNARLLREIQAAQSPAAGAEIRREFDSLATAHAEAMVYLNRSLREIRAEALSISAAVGRLEAKSVAGKSD